MISPEQFLALLEEKELLSPRTVASLREQIAQSAEPITAAALAKRLVKHGRLTPSQAKRLLAADDEKPSPAKSAAKPQPKAGDDLGFAPIEGEQADDEPREAAGEKRLRARDNRRPRRRNRPLPAPAAPRGSLLDDETPSRGRSVERGSLDGIMSDTAMSGTVAGGPLTSAGLGPQEFLASLRPQAERPEEDRGGKVGRRR